MPFYVLHYDARLAVVFEKVVERDDVLVAKLGGVARFVLKAFEGGGVGGHFRRQDLERDALLREADEAIRQMFASAAVRKEVPVEEQLGLMPFKISELSDFKNIRTLAVGAAVILADGDEATGFEAAPFMILGVIYMIYLYRTNPQRVTDVGLVHLDALEETT